MSKAAVQTTSACFSADAYLTRAVDCLTPPPNALLELIELRQDAAAELARAVRSSVAAVEGVLTFAHRTGCQGQTNDTTVREVIASLSPQETHHAAVCAVFADYLSAAAAGIGCAQTDSFLKHSLQVACLGRSLAHLTSRADDVNDVFLGGLLHDVGKIALQLAMPKSYARVLSYGGGHLRSSVEAERSLCHIDHTDAGRRLAVLWDLRGVPGWALWLHHHPIEFLISSNRDGRLLALVQLADRLVHEEAEGYCNDPQHGPATADVWQMLGVTDLQVDRALSELPNEIARYWPTFELSPRARTRSHKPSVLNKNDSIDKIIAGKVQCVPDAGADSGVPYLAAGANLVEAALSCISLEEACLHAASSLQSAWQLPAVIVYSPSDTSGHFVMAAARGHRCKTYRFDIDDAITAHSSIRPRPVCFQAPGGHAEIIAGEFAHLLGDQPLSWCPLSAKGRIVGGVLIAYEPERIWRINAHPNELQRLCSGYGSLLWWAAAGTATENLLTRFDRPPRAGLPHPESLTRRRTLDTIVEMAGGISHELNNPLAIISGRAQILAQITADEEARRTLKTISEQAHRASDIVADLLKLAKPDPPSVKIIVLKDFLSRLRQRWLTGSRLTPDHLSVRLSDDRVSVLADASDLEQILDAALANALDSGPQDKVHVDINCDSRPSDERVLLDVNDNGSGMEPRVLARAFDPFFSHRPAGRSQGMGLPIAARLAELNGGRVWLTSKRHAGTHFYLELRAC